MKRNKMTMGAYWFQIDDRNFETWLSGKLQLNLRVSHLTTKSTKITKERQNILTFHLRVLRAHRG